MVDININTSGEEIKLRSKSKLFLPKTRRIKEQKRERVKSKSRLKPDLESTTEIWCIDL